MAFRGPFIARPAVEIDDQWVDDVTTDYIRHNSRAVTLDGFTTYLERTGYVGVVNIYRRDYVGARYFTRAINC